MIKYIPLRTVDFFSKKFNNFKITSPRKSCYALVSAYPLGPSTVLVLKLIDPREDCRIQASHEMPKNNFLLYHILQLLLLWSKSYSIIYTYIPTFITLEKLFLKGEHCLAGYKSFYFCTGRIQSRFVFNNVIFH